MIIIYEPETLAVQYTVTQYSSEFREYLDTVGGFIEWNGTASIEQIRLSLVDGEAAVVIAPFMTVSAPITLVVGVEATFSGIPEDAEVSINGAAMGEMDAAGVLEFTPETDGLFAFRFTHPDFVAYEVRLEAVTL